MNILIVEDSRAGQLMLRKNAEEVTSSIRCVGTLQEALEHAEWARLVLLDLNLPDSSGLDTVAEMRRFTSAKIVVCSQVTDPENCERAGYLGADVYFGKNPQDATLGLTLKCLAGVDRREAEADAQAQEFLGRGNKSEGT